MPTPTENFEIATDESRSDEEREQAIDQLEAANECDMLADIVGRDDLDGRYRELALVSLGRPQCTVTLQRLVDEGTLPEALGERAESLLAETPADSGAGP